LIAECDDFKTTFNPILILFVKIIIFEINLEDCLHSL
jgi:hypothetical protein